MQGFARLTQRFHRNHYTSSFLNRQTILTRCQLLHKRQLSYQPYQKAHALSLAWPCASVVRGKLDRHNSEDLDLSTPGPRLVKLTHLAPGKRYNSRPLLAMNVGITRLPDFPFTEDREVGSLDVL